MLASVSRVRCNNAASKSPVFAKGSVVVQTRKVAHFHGKPHLKEVVIVSAVRTPIGSIGGSLASLTASDLGSIAIKGALEKAKVAPQEVTELYMGNVLAAGQGQAPARQAAVKAGLPLSTVCTTVNKVCSSGLKSVMLASQTIMLGDQGVFVAGGMESMSNVPYYLDKARSGYKYGHGQLLDGVLKDGLWDVYNDFHMGNCAEESAKKFGITRAQQDEFAVESYKRAADAYKSGAFQNEMVPVTLPGKKGEQPTKIVEDEEYKKLKVDKIATLKPAFLANGTVTAANASKLNDGASALVLMSADKAKALGLKPIAKVLGFADAEHAPVDFPTAPALAIPKALESAGVKQSQVDYWEINEAFSVVGLANAKILNLDLTRVSVYGGAVALGHPIGSSGSRIVATLINVLHNKGGSIGVAAICNGGGGASAIVVQKLD
jgi:acetyl-CoA C-acetyltransferase